MGNPHLLSAGQAAKAVGVTTPTISKALKSGRLSYIERTAHGYQIDPTELFRVFPPVAEKEQAAISSLGSATPLLIQETVEVRVANARLEAEVTALKSLSDELRQERDEWRKQAQTLLLSDRSRKADDGRSWLARLLGGGGQSS